MSAEQDMRRISAALTKIDKPRDEMQVLVEIEPLRPSVTIPCTPADGSIPFLPEAGGRTYRIPIYKSDLEKLQKQVEDCPMEKFALIKGTYEGEVRDYVAEACRLPSADSLPQNEADWSEDMLRAKKRCPHSFEATFCKMHRRTGIRKLKRVTVLELGYKPAQEPTATDKLAAASEQGLALQRELLAEQKRSNDLKERELALRERELATRAPSRAGKPPAQTPE